MDEKTYQILYCSRNNIQGSIAHVKSEVEGILRASRRNNAKDGVTGALFFNTVFFAQVLEGGFVDVQRVFERLQLDPRHSDLVVLQSGYVAKRDFCDWSMAYAGASANFELPIVVPKQQDAPNPDSPSNGDKVLAFLRDIVVKQDIQALPERPSMVRLMSATSSSAVSSSADAGI